MTQTVVAPNEAALPSVVQQVMRDKLVELVAVATEDAAVAALLDCIDGEDGEVRSRIVLPDGRAIVLSVGLSMFETVAEAEVG